MNTFVLTKTLEMSKITIVLLLFSSIMFAQFNENSPWIEELRRTKPADEPLNLFEMKAAFDKYWQTHDPNTKGSGHKPFMRYFTTFENATDNDGNIQTAESFMEAFQDKQRISNQTNSVQNTPVSNWQPIGPFSLTNTGSWSAGHGRVNVIEIDPNNVNIWYMGTPAGGIWKSTNAGNNWTPLTDQLPQIGVSGIAIDPSNSNTIYISTGDKNASDSFSFGVYKSTNGGTSWQPTGFTTANQNKGLGDLIINPNNPNQLHVATNNGIFTTLNAGVSWVRGALGNFTQGNIRLKTNDVNTVFAVSNNRFFRSTNSGLSFTQVTTGLPLNSSRMVMDVTAADANYIYVLCFNNQTSSVNNGFLGLYRSVDAGISFQLMNNDTNILESTQGWYDLAICASPTNKDLIFTGCLNVWSSVDGGATFFKINNWNQPLAAEYTHADIHYLGYKGSRLFCGSDGGIYFSDNNGQTFTDRTTTAQIGQFYKISVSPNTNGKLVGGLQDNGGYGFSNNTWKNWYGADGMDNAINPTNDNIFYGLIQYGSSLHISTNAANSRQGSVASPGNIQGRWVTPMVINNTGQLLSGFKRLYRLSGTTGGTWLQQSETLFDSNISDIAVHPQNNSIIYIAVLDELYKSTNSGVDFTYINSFATSITSIAPHQTNVDILYVTTSGSSGNRAFRSIDGGINFDNFSQGLPGVAINVIKHHRNHINDAIYVGTALGVFYRDNITNNFVTFDTNLPNVAVRDLEVFVPTNKLIAATYGRGVWTTDLVVPLSASTFDQASMQIFPNPFIDEITINSNNEIPTEIKIYDFSGKLVSEQRHFTSDSNIIKTNSLATGIYLMKIAFANKIITRKIVKK